jgi:metacaspase-1
MNELRALCCGINDYPGTSSDLAGCVNDATDWGLMLRGLGGEVSYLIDRAATKKAILTVLDQMISASQLGDIAVFTFSGHGTWVPDTNGDEVDGRDEALVPHDIASRGPLLDDDLAAVFASARPGVRLVFISDSCHSGTIARFAPPRYGSPTRVRFLPPEHHLSGPSLPAARAAEHLPVRSRARMIPLSLSGCTDRQYSYDTSFDGRPNGAFTRAALDALAVLPKDASYSAWFRAIRGKLPSSATPQNPQMNATAAQKAWKIFQ